MSSSTSLKDMYYVETAGLVAIPVRHTSTQPKATSFRDGKMNATQRKATEVNSAFLCTHDARTPQMPNLSRPLNETTSALRQYRPRFAA